MERLVSGCHNCPFSNWSIKGKRILHRCNVQETGTESQKEKTYKKEGYCCFKTCPLRSEEFNVSFKTT